VFYRQTAALGVALSISFVVLEACTFNGASGKPNMDGGIELDGAIDGGGMPVVCATPGAMRDHFTTLKVGWDTFDNSVLEVAGEQLKLSNSFTGLAQTRYAVDLRNARFSFELIELSDGKNRFGLTSLDLNSDDANSIVIEIDRFNNNNKLIVRFAGNDMVSIPYQADKHRLLSFREQAGQLFIEARASISDPWRIVTSVSSPSFVESAYFGFGFQEPGMHSVTIDSLNTSEPPAHWCPLTDLSDKFDDINPLVWRVVDDAGFSSCAVSTKAGVLAINKPPGALFGRCLLVSAKAFDVTARSVAIDVVQAQFSNGALGMQLVDSQQHYAAIVAREGLDTLICARVGQGNQLTTEFCQSLTANELHLEIRHMGDFFKFTATNPVGAIILSMQFPVPKGMSVKELRVELGQTDAVTLATGQSSIEISQISTLAP